MSKRNVAESVAGNAAWEMAKGMAKLLFPFIAAFGIREWVTTHATGLMWAVAVVVAGVIVFWDSRWLPRDRDLSGNMNAKLPLAPEQSREPKISRLKIYSATWGNATSRRSVVEVIEKLPRDALAFRVANDILQCDPAEGDDKKYIEVEYSYGDGPMLKATRPQGSRLVLPEDRQFIVSKASNGPQLLLEYKPQTTSPLEDELLVFINESAETLKILGVSSLTWNTIHKRHINLHSALGPLRAGQSIDCKFAAYEQKDKLQIIQRMTAILREADSDAQTSLVVRYQDMNGNTFSRQYFLIIDPYNRVVCDPGPVQREQDEEAAH